MRHDIDLTRLNRREIGYLIGFYIGDGNIFIKKETGVYRLRIFTYIKEKEIQEKLKKILLKIFDKLYCYPKQDNTFVIEKNSTELVDYIQKTCDKNGLKVKKSKEFNLGYIEGLIDSDGYVQRNFTEITTVNPKLKDQIIEILKKFGIKASLRRFPRTTSPGEDGFRIGFSLIHGEKFFSPVKWASGVQTAG